MEPLTFLSFFFTRPSFMGKREKGNSRAINHPWRALYPWLLDNAFNQLGESPVIMD
jgi:hypothetical protein